MKIPIRRASALWHVGELDPSKKHSKGISFEGNLFSMSACPDAWSSIARLGGNTLHKTGRPVVLLDMREVLYGDSPESERIRKLALKFAESRGYVEFKTVYCVSWEDDELEQTCCMTFHTLEQALEEVRDEPPYQKSYIACTPLLNFLHGWPDNQVHDGLEFSVVEWARELSTVDGVYWDEILDVSRYTAPRAGLFSTHDLGLKHDVEKLDDDERLESVSEIEWITTKALLNLKPDHEPGC